MMAVILLGVFNVPSRSGKRLFSQNYNPNRDSYKKMENEWADWNNEGFEVKLITLGAGQSGADRPTNIMSGYELLTLIPVMLYLMEGICLITLWVKVLTASLNLI